MVALLMRHIQGMEAEPQVMPVWGEWPGRGPSWRAGESLAANMQGGRCALSRKG